LELKLYQSAPSFEAYLDKFTESGLQQLAVRVAMERWPSCAQLVKAALNSKNDIKAVSNHEVIQQDKGDVLLMLHRKMDDAQVRLLKIQVETLEAEKAMAITEIEANNAEITSLSNEVETLKLERDQLQRKIEHDVVAMQNETECDFATLKLELIELQRNSEHEVAAVQREMDRVTNEKLHVDIRLKEAMDELKAKDVKITSLVNEVEALKLEHNELHHQFDYKDEVDRIFHAKTQVDTQLREVLYQLQSRESLLGDKEEALEQLQLLKQQSDAEIEYLKLQVLTMRAEITTLASEKAKAVEEATRAALESKSLLEDVQALKSKHDKLEVDTQSMSVQIMAMEKDVVESFLKDRKIKALAEKVEALTVRKDAYDAALAKADMVVQSEESTHSLLLKDSEIAQILIENETMKETIRLLTAEKAADSNLLEKLVLDSAYLKDEVQVLKSEKLLINQMNVIKTDRRECRWGPKV
jgi:chromosome segregation ATPase